MAILGLAVFLASDSAILADPNLGQLQGRCVAAFMLKQHSSDSRNFRLMTPRTSRLNSLEKEGVLLWARQAGIFHRCCGWCCCGRYSSHRPHTHSLGSLAGIIQRTQLCRERSWDLLDWKLGATGNTPNFHQAAHGFYCHHS